MPPRRRITPARLAEIQQQVAAAISTKPERHTATVIRSCGHEEAIEYFGADAPPEPATPVLCQQCRAAEMEWKPTR